jgi:hypothetical protein
VSSDRERDIGSNPTVSMTEGGNAPIVEDEHSRSAFDVRGARFEELGELGRGGMGRVADAFDRSLARQVAVKSALARDPAVLARFEREVRITAQLEHPSIVPLYEAGRAADGTPYYVMRRVDGKPLEDAVRGASLERRLALVPNLLAVCDAAGFAHARAIVHRDIKPDNVLLGRFGETLLIDWGLARRFDDDDRPSAASPGAGLTRAGAVTGTPGFMSPEQARGERADARSDVYSLGATLFYVLAGEPPHLGRTGEETIAATASGKPPRWHQLSRGVPDDLRAILARALAADPAQRYRDAGALAADLRQFVTGNLVAAHRYSALERLGRLIRRHRVAVAVGSIAAAVLAAVLIIAVGRIANERDAANEARVREAARADELTLAKARLLLDTNPTLAVALVRPLAASDRWRDVSDVLAAAVARGVAWRLPVSGEALHVAIAPDGVHALAVASDGQIWFYDLRTRSSRVVYDLARVVDDAHPALLAWRADGQLAVFEGKQLVLLDPMTSAHRSIVLAVDAAAAYDSGGVVSWVDRTLHAWRLDGETPRAIDVGEEARKVVASPDGKQLVVIGRTALWWVDAGGNVHQLLAAAVRAVAWSSTSTDLVLATSTGQVRIVHLAETPVWDSGDLGHFFPDSLVASDDHYAMQNGSGLWSDLATVQYNGQRPAGLEVARDGMFVAAESGGKIEILDGAYRQQLFSPDGRLDTIAARASSSFVIAAAGTDVLVWDLDAVLPRRLADVDPIVAAMRGGPHAVLVPAGPAVHWIDLHSFAVLPAPSLNLESPVVVSPSGELAMTMAGDVTLMQVGASQGRVVAHGARIARFVDDDHIAVCTTAGRVDLHDLKTGAISVLAPGGAHNVRARDGVVTISLDDGRFERVVLATGTHDTIRPVAPVMFDQIATGGRLWLVWGNQLACWEPDGQLVTFAATPRAIRDLFVTEDHVVIDTDESGFVVDASRPGSLQRIIPLGTIRLSDQAYEGVATQGGDYLAAPRNGGGALVLDAETGTAWTVGQAGPAGERAIALDGSVLYEQRGHTLAVWPLAIARSRFETLALALRLTNAVQ